MPSILSVPANSYHSNTVEVTLDKEGLVVDPRVILLDRLGIRFECTIEGRKLTLRVVAGLMRIRGWNKEVIIRLYDPEVEKTPSFNSSDPYMYHGLKREIAPFDVLRVDIAPHVKIIKKFALFQCKDLKTCTMGDGVVKIGEGAFNECTSLEKIRLSKSLRVIGPRAFASCTSIDFMFIPPRVQELGDFAFFQCSAMRFLILPPNIQLNRIGDHIVDYMPSWALIQGR